MRVWALDHLTLLLFPPPPPPLRCASCSRHVKVPWHGKRKVSTYFPMCNPPFFRAYEIFPPVAVGYDRRMGKQGATRRPAPNACQTWQSFRYVEEGGRRAPPSTLQRHRRGWPTYWPPLLRSGTHAAGDRRVTRRCGCRCICGRKPACPPMTPSIRLSRTTAIWPSFVRLSLICLWGANWQVWALWPIAEGHGAGVWCQTGQASRHGPLHPAAVCLNAAAEEPCRAPWQRAWLMET